MGNPFSLVMKSTFDLSAPKGYKKDTIDAIEEEEMEENSDIDIESGLGTSQKSKNKRKKKKKRQDYRNKLEDWQTCLVSYHLKYKYCILWAIFDKSFGGIDVPGGKAVLIKNLMIE